MKLLITSSWKSFNNFKKRLPNNCEVIFFANESEKVEHPELYDAVICNNLFLYNDIRLFKKLKYIQLTSVGFDRIPMEYALDNQIIVKNIGDAYASPIAEYVISTLLFYFKRLMFFENNKKNRCWIKNREVDELCNKNVLIFGCGNVGSAIAKRLSAFGVNIFGVDILPKNLSYFQKIFSQEEYKTALAEADIIIVCMPLSKDTIHYFNKSIFNLFKTGSVFVNVSRGKVVVEEDLLDALQKNISYAILDVFDEEPLPNNSPFWTCDNVFISPHNSFEGVNNGERVGDIIVKNFNEWFTK